MKISFAYLSLACLTVSHLNALAADAPAPSQVDYPAFAEMTDDVRDYRQGRLVSLDRFLEMAAQDGTLILDTRSASAFNRRHLKGAVHLEFSEFTDAKLASVIPSKTTRILIYCNNNFKDDPFAFAAKRRPLALNIPTFINLYGYGYKNVYELSELVSVNDERLTFEGSSQSRNNP